MREGVEKSIRFQRNKDGVRSRADISGLFSKREEPVEVVGGVCFLRLGPSYGGLLGEMLIEEEGGDLEGCCE